VSTHGAGTPALPAAVLTVLAALTVAAAVGLVCFVRRGDRRGWRSGGALLGGAAGALLGALYALRDPAFNALAWSVREAAGGLPGVGTVAAAMAVASAVAGAWYGALAGLVAGGRRALTQQCAVVAGASVVAMGTALWVWPPALEGRSLELQRAGVEIVSRQAEHLRAATDPVSALRDPSPHVRFEAALALANAGDPRGLRVLLAAIGEPGRAPAPGTVCPEHAAEDRVEAIRALGCLKEEAARSALLDVLEREAPNAGRSDGSERAGEAAAFAAGEAGETRALPALLRMARTPWDGRSFTPQAAADAIVKIAARTGAAGALKTVASGLRDPALRDRFLWAEGQLVRVRSGKGLDAVRRLYAADRRSLVAATGRAR